MSDRMPVRLRCLPDGPFQQALEVGGQGRFLYFDLEEGVDRLAPGSLVEIDDGLLILLGELVERQGPRAVVQVEHSIDRSRVPAIEESWA